MAETNYPEVLEGIKNKIGPIIQSMEDGEKADDQLLDEVKEDSLAILIFLKNYLISKNDPFTSLFFKSLELKVDFKLPGLLKVVPKPTSMLFNPLMCENFTLKQLAYEVKKQVMHIVYDHQSYLKNVAGNKEDLRKLATANDAQINDVIQSEEISKFKTKSGKLKLEKHPDGITSETVETLTGITCKEKSTNVYYTKILDSKIDDMNEQQQQTGTPQIPGILGPDGQPMTGTPDPNAPSYESDKHGQGIKTPHNINDTDIHEYGTQGKNGDELTDDYRRAVEDVMNSMSAKERGEMSGGMLAQIQMLLEPPKLDWKKILKRFVGSIPEGKKRSPFRLNRKMPTNPMVRGKLNDKTIDIMVAIDTSGSMSDKEIEWAFSEIKGMLSGRRYKITVIECDWDIGAIYDLDSEKKVDQIKEVSGRGGTQFAPVIKYLNDREYRDEMNQKFNYSHRRDPKESLFIYFTDGGGEWEINRPNVHRAMWILTRPVEEMSVKDLHGGALVSLVDDKTFVRNFR